MAIKLVKLSIKLRALALPKASYNNRSADNYDLKRCIDTPNKASRFVVTACRMSAEQSVQQEWMRICTTESEIERAKKLLQLDTTSIRKDPQSCSIQGSPLYHSTAYSSNRTGLRQPNRKMSSYTPFSLVKREEIDRIAGVSVTKLLSNPVLDVNKIIRIRELPLGTLKKIYETLCYFIGGFGIPNAYSKESVCSVYVSAVLAGVVHHVKQEHQLEDVIVEKETEFAYTDLRLRGKMDFVIVNGERKLIVVECKKFNPDYGIVQCILALKSMWECNDDGRDTFGFATNGVDWRFVRYNGNRGKKAEVFIVQTLLFPYMEYKDSEENWISHNTKILHIIYSALLETLNK